MAKIYQVVWVWANPSGGAGYTNLFYDGSVDSGSDALAAVTKSRALFFNLQAVLPSGTSIAPSTDVRVLEDTDGKLQNIYTVTGVGGISGLGNASNAAPAGACIDWLTLTVHGSRRIQGRTFVVPIPIDKYESNGSLLSGAVATIASAAETMRTGAGPAFGVWGRPVFQKPHTTPPTLLRAGKWGAAVSSRVPDKVAMLTSRRD
jgi:hypothetical protein